MTYLGVFLDGNGINVPEDMGFTELKEGLKGCEQRCEQYTKMREQREQSTIL